MGRQKNKPQFVWLLLALFVFTGATYLPSSSFQQSSVFKTFKSLFIEKPVVEFHPKVIEDQKPSALSQSLQEKFQISRMMATSA